MTATFIPGQRVVVDRSTPATFVRALGDKAIIRVGLDTRVVDAAVLTSEDA